MNGKIDKIQRLIEIMDVLIDLHRRLLNVEESKIEAIVNQDWKRLQVLLQESEILMSEIEDVEEERIRLIKDAGYDAESSISEISVKLPENIRVLLEKSRDNLIGIVNELKEINRKTRAMLEGSLEVINFTLGLLSGGNSRVKTYGIQGKEIGETEHTSSMVFDFKA